MAERSTPGPDPAPHQGGGAGSLAQLLDRVVWDYSPRSEEPSPLLSTARFFDEFPWDGGPVKEAARGSSPDHDDSGDS